MNMIYKRLLFGWFVLLASIILSFTQATQANTQTDYPVQILSTPTSTPVAVARLDPEITLLFTGQIVPGRCVQAAVDAKGNADYIFQNIQSIIQDADLAIGTLNGSMTNYCPYIGCVDWSMMLVGSPIQAKAMANAGFDGMSTATNHINNCTKMDVGYQPLFDTLTALKDVGIQPIGAGKNLTEASQPIVFTVKGVRFVIVSLGEIEANAFATANKPGIGVLDEANLKSTLQMAQTMGDVVIFMPHWGPEYSPLPNPGQQKYAREAVAYGADLIVGNHTHVIQAMQTIDGIPVFYGLGNFVFDQSWELRLRSSLLLKITFVGARLKNYELIPVVSKKTGMVSLANEKDRLSVLATFKKNTSKVK